MDFSIITANGNTDMSWEPADSLRNNVWLSLNIRRGTFFAAMDIGIGGGSIVLGWLVELTSFQSMYLFCAAYVVIPLIYFLSYVVRDYERKTIQTDSSVELNSKA